jgi:hypothetical protein
VVGDVRLFSVFFCRYDSDNERVVGMV